MADDDFNTRNIEEFRANQGKLGGNFEGAPPLRVTARCSSAGSESDPVNPPGARSR